MKGNIFKYHFLLSELVKKGIKLRYRRSYLGILWSLIEPIMTTCVLVIVFGTLFNNKSPTYPLYILTGRLIYSYFSEGTKTASHSIRNNAEMIKKVYIPKVLYPLSGVLYSFVIFCISLLVLVGLAIYCRISVTPRLLMFIPTLLLLLLLTFGVGFFLATLNVFFKDIEYIWNVLLMIIMYMSAIFYYPERLQASRYAFVLDYNPLYQIILMARSSILGEPFNIPGIIYTLIVSVVMILIATAFYNANKNKFILNL